MQLIALTLLCGGYQWRPDWLCGWGPGWPPVFEGGAVWLALWSWPTASQEQRSWTSPDGSHPSWAACRIEQTRRRHRSSEPFSFFDQLVNNNMRNEVKSPEVLEGEFLESGESYSLHCSLLVCLYDVRPLGWRQVDEALKWWNTQLV